MDNQLVLSKTPTRSVPFENWHKKSLRKCLLALGVTDEEMRYRKGARAIIDSWGGEANNLLEIAKKKWKQHVVKFHEAGINSNPEQWKNFNTIYSAALKKIFPFLSRNLEKKCKLVDFECIVCGKYYTIKTNNGFSNRKVCDDPKCKKEHYRRLYHKYRLAKKITYDRTCRHCGIRFVTTDNRKKSCSKKCNMLHQASVWKQRHPERFREIQRRRKWRIRTAPWTEEQRTLFLERQRERRAAILEKETPEKRERRLSKQREYRKNRISKGWKDPKKPRRAEWLEKKRLELINKPWIYETLVQKYTRPDGSISQTPVLISDKEKERQKIMLRERRKRRIANETVEERERRLEKMRIYMRFRRAQKHENKINSTQNQSVKEPILSNV